MKVYTSYFYQIRFFPPNYIPISTAMSDPKWFHDFKEDTHVFKDKRGVYNGIRCYPLQPGECCNGLCGGAPCIYKPDSCAFLLTYRAQLNKLDFQKFMDNLKAMLQRTEVENPVPVFIVYEKPTAQCSERGAIQWWFNSNGVECEELNLQTES